MLSGGQAAVGHGELHAQQLRQQLREQDGDQEQANMHLQQQQLKQDAEPEKLDHEPDQKRWQDEQHEVQQHHQQLPQPQPGRDQKHKEDKKEMKRQRQDRKRQRQERRDRKEERKEAMKKARQEEEQGMQAHSVLGSEQPPQELGQQCEQQGDQQFKTRKQTLLPPEDLPARLQQGNQMLICQQQLQQQLKLLSDPATELGPQSSHIAHTVQSPVIAQLKLAGDGVLRKDTAVYCIARELPGCPIYCRIIHDIPLVSALYLLPCDWHASSVSLMGCSLPNMHLRMHSQ